MYSCHLFLIFSASIRPIPFLSFIVPVFAWNVPLVSLIFWKRSLLIPILLFASISLHWSPRKAFLSLFAVLCNSAFRLIYLSFSPLPLASLLFSAICKASSDNHLAFLHFFFLSMILITASYTVSQTSIHSSSSTLFTRSNGSYSIWRRQWQLTPVLLPGKSHGWRSLVGYSPWGHEESDMTEWLYLHFSLSCIGEGNGNPL